MDIFISYRRGEGDSPNAGRIHDYLVSQGYTVFYDQDEKALPTGAQFPEALARGVESSRVILAVIGNSWITQMPRLRQENDWVRAELRRAEPATGRHFLPVYLGTQPGQLGDGLPDDLAFVARANSHCLWSRFEAPEKAALLNILAAMLPPPARPGLPDDVPRLELLCDRAREEACFRRALRGAEGGWLLLGSEEQGQHALFERLRAFTLRLPALAEHFPASLAIRLDLDEFPGRPLGELRDHLFQRGADTLREDEVGSWDDLLAKLARRRVALALFWSVVRAADVKQARSWEARFDELLADLPLPGPGGPRLFLALALCHGPAPSGLLSFLKRDVADYLAGRYPEAEDAPPLAGGAAFATSWLRSARRLDVENWCSNQLVRPHLSPARVNASLRPFDQAPEIPMGRLVNHLAKVLGEATDTDTATDTVSQETRP